MYVLDNDGHTRYGALEAYAHPAIVWGSDKNVWSPDYSTGLMTAQWAWPCIEGRGVQ